MPSKEQNEKEETHPLLPSGEWEGFYCYHSSPEQHKMLTELNFSNSMIAGSGTDDVAAFTWKGKYDLENFKLQMTKSYASHSVFYRGNIDENGIWGVWELAYDFSKIPQHFVSAIKEALKMEMTGGFHIWPKKMGANYNAAEAKTESEKLKEIFTEVFS